MTTILTQDDALERLEEVVHEAEKQILSDADLASKLVVIASALKRSAAMEALEWPSTHYCENCDAFQDECEALQSEVEDYKRTAERRGRYLLKLWTRKRASS